MPSARTRQAIARLKDLTPRQVVFELDRHIVGQSRAKKSVAIALRNRWRRQQAPESIRDEIASNNIILIGSTGVGKTEIARRLAKLAGAPFVKVEASKFTEVGYVGRDVTTMVRDLIANAIDMVRDERRIEVENEAEAKVEDRLLDLLLPVPATTASGAAESPQSAQEAAERHSRTREKFRSLLRDGQLETREVEIRVSKPNRKSPSIVLADPTDESMTLGDIFQGMMPGRTKSKTVSVKDARRILKEEEAEKLIDMDDITTEAIERAESMGIIFLDEIDKIATSGGQTAGPDVSRQGVQRDLLPIVEGSSVQTRYGTVKTDHVLFIAAGAFHVAKPSDLIPELQGRFPIRVELDSLTEADFIRIMTEPENSLTRQYCALVEAEGATLTFSSEGIAELARVAASLNERMENIGARRLHTVMTMLLENVLFELPEGSREPIVVDAAMVRERLQALSDDEDLRKYIL